MRLCILMLWPVNNTIQLWWNGAKAASAFQVKQLRVKTLSQTCFCMQQQCGGSKATTTGLCKTYLFYITPTLTYECCLPLQAFHQSIRLIRSSTYSCLCTSFACNSFLKIIVSSSENMLLDKLLVWPPHHRYDWQLCCWVYSGNPNVPWMFGILTAASLCRSLVHIF